MDSKLSERAKWCLVLAMAEWVLSSGVAWSMNTIDLTGNVKWKCEDDTQVSLDLITGLRITSNAANVDQTLSFHSCHFSRCNWGPKETAALCEQAPCAEIVAYQIFQTLSFKLVGHEGSCKALKSDERQD